MERRIPFLPARRIDTRTEESPSSVPPTKDVQERRYRVVRLSVICKRNASQLKRAVLKMDAFPAGMEMFPSADQSSRAHLSVQGFTRKARTSSLILHAVTTSGFRHNVAAGKVFEL